MVIFLFSIFIAFAFGLILYFSIEDKIPDELSMLKGGKAIPTRVAASGADASYKNWDIYSKDGIRLVNGTSFIKKGSKDQPFLITVECARGQLNTYIQYPPGLNFNKPDRSDTAIVYMGEVATKWSAIAQYTDKYVAQQPHAVLDLLLKGPIKTTFLEYHAKETNPTQIVVQTDGLAELANQLPENCLNSK